MPADLFKKAPEAFRKRAWILINIILAGHYVCSEKLLEAWVVLLCKDHGNPTLLANYRLIALYNSFYQLINIIIASRIRGLTEKYAMLGPARIILIKIQALFRKASGAFLKRSPGILLSPLAFLFAILPT